MFKKILLPLDGSENAERALPWVKRYARPRKAQVVLAQAVPALPSDEWFVLEPGADEAREYLQRIERELNFCGIPAKIVVRKGHVAPTIVQVAERERCGLVVMTTRGGSKVARWVMGGVTEQVMRLSPVPVLVVQSYSRLSNQGRVSRILVPLDGSALAESILPWAEELVRFHRAPLEFIHICPPGRRAEADAYQESFAAFRGRLARHCRDLRERGVRATLRVEQGDPAEEILKKIGQTDLVAMTTHGHGGFKRWILGSVAEKVIHAGVVPVFVYKAPTPQKGSRRSTGTAMAQAASAP